MQNTNPAAKRVKTKFWARNFLGFATVTAPPSSTTREQILQILELNIQTWSARQGNQESIIIFHQNIVYIMNRAKEVLSSKLQSNITFKINNHFQSFKVQCDQGKMIYKVCIMVLQMKKFEILPNWRADVDSVVVWSFGPETDAAKAFQWWMMIDVWLEMACNNFKKALPWMRCEEDSPAKASHSCENGVVMSPKGCWDDEQTMSRLGSLELFWQKVEKCKNEVWEKWVIFLLVFCCVWWLQLRFSKTENDKCLCCFMLLVVLNQRPWKMWSIVLLFPISSKQVWPFFCCFEAAKWCS